jgi:hypothetical protein
VWFVGAGSGIIEEFSYLFQRHAGMDLINVDCELILDALNLTIGVMDGHQQSKWANREVLSHALELAADPVVILLLLPPVFQLIHSFA